MSGLKIMLDPEEEPGPETPLRKVKAWLWNRIKEGGTKCPACGQNAAIYKRRIGSTQARALVDCYRLGGTTTFVHVNELFRGQSCEIGKLRWWGLVEEERTRRPDGGRAGYWRVTDKGERWLRGVITVEKTKYVYDNAVLGSDDGSWSIHDALGHPFDLTEIGGPVQLP